MNERDWADIGDEIAGARRSMTGAYLVNRHGDSVSAYGETNEAGGLRVQLTEAASGGVQIRMQAVNPAADMSITIDPAQLGTRFSGVLDQVFSMIDPIGMLVDVDHFEGEGEDWHDEIDDFTDAIDLALDGPPAPAISKLSDSKPAAMLDADSPAQER